MSIGGARQFLDFLRYGLLNKRHRRPPRGVQPATTGTEGGRDRRPSQPRLGAETGRWQVTTETSLYLLDLDNRTALRCPDAGAGPVPGLPAVFVAQLRRDLLLGAGYDEAWREFNSTWSIHAEGQGSVLKARDGQTSTSTGETSVDFGACARPAAVALRGGGGAVHQPAADEGAAAVLLP